MTVLVKRMSHTARLPQRMHEGDACLDAYASESREVWPGQVARIPLGVALELERGWECVVRPRSGLTLKGLICIPGTVDSGYRGEVCAMMHNASSGRIMVSAGDRVAQLAIRKVHKVQIVEVVDELSATTRGASGFGSTGAADDPVG